MPPCLFSYGFNPIKPSEKMNKAVNINDCFKSVGKGFVCLLEDKCNYIHFESEFLEDSVGQ